MRNQWKKEIYIAKKARDENGENIIDRYGNVKYEKPKKYLFNVQPTNGRTDIMDYGQKAIQMQRAIVDYKKYIGMFNIDDLAYLDGATPKGEFRNGDNANFRIDAILNQNKVIVIYFEKLTEK
jgi:hypothetical protein